MVVTFCRLLPYEYILEELFCKLLAPFKPGRKKWSPLKIVSNLLCTNHMRSVIIKKILLSNS